MTYPDYELIRSLSDLYLSKSIAAMTTDQITDLINHLREYNNQLILENKRLTIIVEAPWKCDVCGNYIGNDCAVPYL